MARAIDTTKLERIKKATVDLVVDKGYGGASTASIARRAQVSEGYLYRFYSSKYALVSDIFYSLIRDTNQEVAALLRGTPSVAGFVRQMVDYRVERFEANSENIKFVGVMMNAYNFEVSENMAEDVREVCLEILEKGKKDGELSDSLELEDVFMMIYTVPLNYLNAILRGYMPKVSVELMRKKMYGMICRGLGL